MSYSLINDGPYRAAEILTSLKPDVAPRIAMILGSGLGVLSDEVVMAERQQEQIEALLARTIDIAINRNVILHLQLAL